MKKILCCVSEWGYWGEELVAPLEVFKEYDIEVDFMTPKGGRAHALPPSMEEGYYDPPLQKIVTDAYYAKATKDFDDSETLDHPMNLMEWFPERPYFNNRQFGHELVDYHAKRDACWKELEAYDALLLPGGSGPMVDMVNNQRLHDVILGFYRMDKLIVAECYCVTCLAFARDYTDRTSIIKGKHVTGHAVEYDYKDGTGFLKSGDLNFGPPFYPLEYILRDAVGESGTYHGGVGHERQTILDYPFLTGRSTQDSRLIGELVVDVLYNGRRRYGW